MTARAPIPSPADQLTFAGSAHSRALKEGYQHLFSIVIALHNAQSYLEEAVESVISQTIGFDFTQLVLVDDGSTDGSWDLCERYARRFPDRVIALKQENGGVSNARNNGMAHARGKYVNFLDSDDIWSPESWLLDIRIQDSHAKIPNPASRNRYFGDREGEHRLNYKFSTERVIDLATEYDCPQLSSSTCFFRAEALRGRRFDESLSVSEDVKLVNEILIDTPRYGAVQDAEYLYRRREQDKSAISGMKANLSWYFDTPERCYRYLFELSRGKHGRILPFVQYTVMYDLQWRLRGRAGEFIDAGQMQRYRALLAGLLADIDDGIIAEQKSMTIDRNAYAFSLKYATSIDEVRSCAHVRDDMLYSTLHDKAGQPHDVPLRPLSKLSDMLVIENVGVDGGQARIEGYIRSFCFRPEDVRIELWANNRSVDVSVFATDKRALKTTFDEPSVGKTGFSARIPVRVRDDVRLKAQITLLGSVRRPMRFALACDGPAREYAEGLYEMRDNAFFHLGAPDALIVSFVGDDEKRLQDAKARLDAIIKQDGRFSSLYHPAPWQDIEAS